VGDCAETLAARKVGLRGNPNETVERDARRRRGIGGAPARRIRKTITSKAACYFYAASDLTMHARAALVERGGPAGREPSDLADMLLKESALLIEARKSFLHARCNG
jgi:hypothetical protein